MAVKYTKKQLADMIRSRPNAEMYKGLDDNAIFERVVAARPEVKNWVQEEVAPPPPGKFQQFKDLAKRGFERLAGKEAGPAYDVRQAQPPKLEVGGYELAGNLQPGSAETIQKAEEPEAAAALRRGQQAVAAVGTGALKTAEFGAALANAMVGTALPFNWEASKRQWQRVSELGEAAPLEEISNVLGSALIVYGGYEGLKAAPALYNLARNSNLMRRLRIPERGLATIPDEQMYRIYQTAPDEVKKEMATYNPQVRSILLDPAKVERFSAPRAAPPTPATPIAPQAAAVPAAARPAALPAIAPRPAPAAAPSLAPAAAPVAPAAPAAVRGSMLPAELQDQYRRNQVAVLEEIIARGEIKPQEISELVFDKARDGVTLRTILERKMIELPGQHELAVKQAADEYAAFLKGVKMTSAAQAAAPAPAAMPAPAPTPVEPPPLPAAIPTAPAVPPRETIWNMPIEKLQPIILKEGWEAPPWKSHPEVAKDMQLYPEGEAFRKWRAEMEIFNRGSKHRVPPELIEKYNLYEELNMAIDREVDERQAQIQDYIDRRGGNATPFWTATKKAGFINKNKLLRWLQIETGRDWKNHEFPEELAWVVRENGEMSVEGMADALNKLGLIPEAEAQLYIDGLLQDWKYKQAEKTGKVFEEVTRPNMPAKMGIEGDLRKKAPAIDLPGQQMIPGSGPAMASTKIVRELNIDPDDFAEGFTAQPETPSLFEALDEAEAAAKEVGKPTTPAGDATTAAPPVDIEPPAASFQAPNQDKEFKLWRATEQLIQKYARRYGEDKYLPRGAAGVYYDGTKNIFLQAANNVFVAAHEVAHFVDTKTDWFTQFMQVVGTTKDGKPVYEAATLPQRKLLTEFYLEFYGGASKSAPLRKRMREGLAMLVEKAIETPEIMDSPKWKGLYDTILRPGGKYYNTTFAELVKDGQTFIKQYRALDPNSQIGARVAAEDRKRNTDTIFTTADNVMEKQFDDLYKFEVMSKKTGLTNKPEDPYNAMQAVKYIGAMQNTALEPGKGLYVPTAKGVMKAQDKNLGDLYNEIATAGKSKPYGQIGGVPLVQKFDNWLIARRVHAGYQRMDALREKILAITAGAYDIAAPSRQGLVAWLEKAKLNIPPDELSAALAEIRESAKEYAEIAAIATNDKIGRDLARRAFEQGPKDFPDMNKWAKQHDDIVGVTLDVLNEAGMLSPERYMKMKDNRAYASFRRDILTIKTNEGQPVKPAAGPLSMLKKRVGSELALQGPMYGLIENYNEAVRAAMAQHAKNKIYNMAKKNEEFLGAVFQRVPLKVRVGKDGAVEFPQLKDPDIIMARAAGKYYPLAVLDRKLLQIMNDNLMSPGATEGLEKIITGISRVFTKGTTGTYPLFAIANVTMDTISAFIQSHTGYKPFYDQARTLYRMAQDSAAPEAEYFKEYMALTGGRQSLAHMYDENRSAEQAYRYLTNEMSLKGKILNSADNFFDVLSAPSKLSEDMTRGQEYINARMAGHDVFTALEMAGQITAPFHHRGTSGGKLGRTWVKSVPYWNASKQVLAQQMKAAQTPENRKRMIFALAALATGMIYSSYAIRQASPAQRRALRGKHPQERANAIWYPVPTAEGRAAGRLARIRLPENYAFVANLINMAVLEAIKEDNFTSGEWVDAGTAFLPDQLNPLETSRFVFSRMPWVIAPALQVAMGVRTYPKVMKLTPGSVEGLPTERQYTENTSEVAKKISATVGADLGLNPIEVDFLIEGYLGGRTTRFVTGRMGSRNISNNFYQDLYLTSTRDMEFYNDLRKTLDAQANLYKEELKNAAAEQRVKVIFPEDATPEDMTSAAITAGVKGVRPSEQLMVLRKFKGRVDDVQRMLRQYRFLSRVKDPGPAAQAELYSVRDRILDQVDQLHQEYDKALDKK